MKQNIASKHASKCTLSQHRNMRLLFLPFHSILMLKQAEQGEGELRGVSRKVSVTVAVTVQCCRPRWHWYTHINTHNAIFMRMPRVRPPSPSLFSNSVRHVQPDVAGKPWWQPRTKAESDGLFPHLFLCLAFYHHHSSRRSLWAMIAENFCPGAEIVERSDRKKIVTGPWDDVTVSASTHASTCDLLPFPPWTVSPRWYPGGGTSCQ